MIDHSEYSLETIRNDGEFILYRGRRQIDATPSSVFALTPASERPPLESLRRMENEYSLRTDLDSGWSVSPIALVPYKERTMLVLTDPGGEPLDRLLGRPMQLTQFLPLAIGLTTALGQVHGRGLIHKDIKPANVLVNHATGQVWLMGFGIASRLPRERQAPEPPGFIAGTLPYMAPEQTGRMNRSIDSRSDLYAFGVTLYEMLTGSLPFTASDPMVLVHCHIARQPIPPCERLKGIPGPVSAIIMKLLAKTAEERYQTASGAASDLRRCLAEWETQHRIDEFPLGEQDMPDRLLIPEKLYGRESEIGTLLASFDRVVASGRPELVLVSGYSGIGKSSVVNELHKPLVPPRGLFASGKFDQYKRDIPYSTLAQAFQSLTRRLLVKSEADLATWRAALLEALGPNGRLMIDLVPELKHVIGDQPPVPDLPPQDAGRRFQLVFRRFIGVFARPDHPLALFLDDLQWLDAATLDLLEDLLIPAGVQHLMLIGAYRDNEVTAAHPLMRKLEAIRNAGANVQEITLAPLAGEDVRQLIADALRCELERAAPLAKLVHEKTAGNPFFLIQFLHTLAEEGWLEFDHEKGRWSWDLDRIHARGHTDNVVDLMVGKLTRLPAETRQALQQLACLGNSEAAMLPIVLGTSEEHVHDAMRPALRQELVERVAGAYRFVHDRAREAAYALIPEDERPGEHLRSGRLLAAHIPQEAISEHVFEIVSQFNRSIALIASDDERQHVAELNLTAGRRAKDATAYASALTYLTAGRALLPEDCWERCGALTFALEIHRAECEFLTGDLAAAEERLSALPLRAANLVDKAAVACLRTALYTTLARADRAVEICVDYLREAGIVWSLHPTDEQIREEYAQLCTQLESRPIEGLFDLPLMSDPDWRATMEVLTELSAPAFFFDGNLQCLTLLRMANLSSEHGNCDGSCYAYGFMNGVVGARFGDYRAGLRFGQLSLDLIEKKGLDRFKARVYFACAAAVFPWGRHVRAALPLFRRGLETALQTGDLTYTAYAYGHLIWNRLTSADPIEEVHREAESALKFAQDTHFALVVDVVVGQLGFIRTIRGLTPQFGSFCDDAFDEGRFEQHLEESPSLIWPACWYWIRKLQARFHAGDYGQALAAAAKARTFLDATNGLFQETDYHFYAALARAAVSDSASPDERREHSEALGEHHKRLALWAENCQENFANRTALVGAEIARIEGRALDAERLYEEAIRSARANGFLHNEALANELAARFYAARGFEQIAHLYLRNARQGYRRWGADGKVRQLDQLHAHLGEEEPALAARGTIATPLEHLELATVLKVSQAISGEMVLDKLIETLMRTAIEHAGAERGLLILQRGHEQRIEAEVTISGDSVIVRQKEAAVGGVPESIVQFVTRTREHVILDDAAAISAFSADAYIQQCHARSILCLPLISQAKLIGVLYLENNLTPHVFTPKRIAVLKLLASQAAISLENARLYRDLEEREAKIRRLVEANIIGIVVWNLDGGIIEANEAFLRMVQYSRGDLVSARVSWKEISPDKWRVADEQALTELAATGFCKPFEKEYFRKDGSCVSVLVGAALFEGRRDEGVAFVLDLTERKRAEEQLRRSAHELQRSEAYLAEGQRLAHLGSWAFDPAGFDYWSPELFRIYGLDPTNKPPTVQEYLDCVHPQDREFMANLIKGILTEASSFDATKRIVRPDGEIRYIRCVGASVVENQRLTKYVGSAIDVTEQELLTQELHSREAYLTEAQRLSHTGSFGWKPVSGDIVWSDETYRIFEYDRAVKPTIDLVVQRVHPEDRGDFQNVIDRASAGATHFEHAYRLLLPDGRVKHVHALAHALQDASGHSEFVGAVMDVTERTRAEESVRRGELNFRRIVDGIPGLVFILTADGEVEFINQQILNYTGRTFEELKRWEITDLVHPDDLPKVIAVNRRSVETGQPHTVEHRLRRADGAYRWFDVSRLSQCDSQGHVIRWYGLLTDIHERKCAEERAQKTQTELAHVARVATLGELTASIAHEVNQPLGAIVNDAGAGLRWLAAQNMDEVRYSIEQVIKNGHRASNIISRIRALVKKTPPQKDRLDVNNIVREIITLAQAEMDMHHVALQIHVPDQVPVVWGDRIQIQQVLLNLIMNAIEAMSGAEEPRTLRVSAASYEESHFLVTVQDSGPGLDVTQLNHVFDAFYTTKPGGLGMGLAISRSIIEAHDGRLWATTNEDRGATFHFTLPFGEERSA